MAATLFSWGWQGFGQCGAGVPGVGDEEALFEPHRVPPFSDSRIAVVAPGNRIIASSHYRIIVHISSIIHHPSSIIISSIIIS
jgi:hypothetical protein